MKIKTSVTERVMAKDNPFKIPSDQIQNFYEVLVRAYTRNGDSVTMSFPRERSKFEKNSPEVVAAIKKAVDMTTDSLVKYLEQRTKTKQ
jgi:hypothetical protein